MSQKLRPAKPAQVVKVLEDVRQTYPDQWLIIEALEAHTEDDRRRLDRIAVIERTLAWGDLPELRWLFARYGVERLAEWVRQAGWYCLPRRRLNYWLCFFDLTDYRRGERIWPH